MRNTSSLAQEFSFSHNFGIDLGSTWDLHKQNEDLMFFILILFHSFSTFKSSLMFWWFLIFTLCNFMLPGSFVGGCFIAGRFVHAHFIGGCFIGGIQRKQKNDALQLSFLVVVQAGLFPRCCICIQFKLSKLMRQTSSPLLNFPSWESSIVNCTPFVARGEKLTRITHVAVNEDYVFSCLLFFCNCFEDVVGS